LDEFKENGFVDETGHHLCDEQVNQEHPDPFIAEKLREHFNQLLESRFTLIISFFWYC
jgi:hypothetical protein